MMSQAGRRGGEGGRRCDAQRNPMDETPRHISNNPDKFSPRRREPSMRDYLNGSGAGNHQYDTNSATGTLWNNLSTTSNTAGQYNSTVLSNNSNVNKNSLHPTSANDDIVFDKASGVTRITAQHQRRHSIQFGGSGPYCVDLTRNRPGETPVPHTNITNIVSDNREQPATVNSRERRQRLPSFERKRSDGYSSDTDVLYSHLKERILNNPNAPLSGRNGPLDTWSTQPSTKPSTPNDDISFDKQSGVTRISATGRQRSRSVQFGGTGVTSGSIKVTPFQSAWSSPESKPVKVQQTIPKIPSIPDIVIDPPPETPTRVREGYFSDTDVLYAHIKDALINNRSAISVPGRRRRSYVPEHHKGTGNQSTSPTQNISQDFSRDQSYRLSNQKARSQSVQFGGTDPASLNPLDRTRPSSASQPQSTNLPSQSGRTRTQSEGYSSDSDILYSHLRNTSLLTPGGSQPRRRRSRDYTPEHQKPTLQQQQPQQPQLQTGGLPRRRRSRDYTPDHLKPTTQQQQPQLQQQQSQQQQAVDHNVPRRRRSRDYTPEHLKPTVLQPQQQPVKTQPIRRRSSDCTPEHLKPTQQQQQQFGGNLPVRRRSRDYTPEHIRVSQQLQQQQSQQLQSQQQHQPQQTLQQFGGNIPIRRRSRDYTPEHIKLAQQQQPGASTLPRRRRSRDYTPDHLKPRAEQQVPTPEDIKFDKQSGITRVPAQRQRRHSVQFGGTGNTCGTAPINPADQSFLPGSNSTQVNTAPASIEKMRDKVEGYSSDTDILYSHIKQKYQPKPQMTAGQPANQLGHSSTMGYPGSQSGASTSRPSSATVNTTSANQAKFYNQQSSSQQPQEDDISFNKSSGVTRIPAQRQRRHSIQLGGTGNSTGLVSGNPFDRRPLTAQTAPSTVSGQNVHRSTSIDTASTRRRAPDVVDGYASDTEVLRSHLKNTSVGEANGRRPSLDDSSDLRHGTAIFIRRPSISSLTLEKDSYIRDADGRAFRKPADSTETPTFQPDGTMSDTEGDSYIQRRIHVRRHSISTPTLRAPFSVRAKPEPTLQRDFQNWEKSANAPAKVPTVIHPVPQPVTATAMQNVQTEPRSSVQGGQLIPVRRHSVTYAPRVDTSDSESGYEQVRSRTYLAPDQSTSQKRTRRRRCRPLSIVKEDVSPLSGTDDDPDGEYFRGFANGQAASKVPQDVVTYEPERATINMSGRQGRRNSDTEINVKGENNLNIMATGNVNINVNTTQPLAMMGSSKDNSGNFALWTSGADPRHTTGTTPALMSGDPAHHAQIGYPSATQGMWRQGNVLVDSMSPMVGGQPMPYGAPVVYPGYGWSQPNQYPGPMMLVPCNPQGYYPGNQQPAPYPQIEPAKQSHTPLSVETSAAPSGGMTQRPDILHGIHSNASGNPGIVQTATTGQGQTHPQHSQNQRQQMQPLRQTHQPQGSVSEQPNAQSRCNGSIPSYNTSAATVNGSHTNDMNFNCNNNNNCASDDSGNETEEPKKDIKDIIANFEQRRKSSGGSVSMPQFGTAYKKTSGKLGTGPQTEQKGKDSDPGYELEVEKREGWAEAEGEAGAEQDPTKLHAYIAEMSISEVRYSDGEEK